MILIWVLQNEFQILMVIFQKADFVLWFCIACLYLSVSTYYFCVAAWGTTSDFSVKVSWPQAFLINTINKWVTQASSPPSLQFTPSSLSSVCGSRCFRSTFGELFSSLPRHDYSVSIHLFIYFLVMGRTAEDCPEVRFQSQLRSKVPLLKE